MAWIAVDTKGNEHIFHMHPTLNTNGYYEDTETYNEIRGITTNAKDYSIKLPKGSIKKLIGKELTWKDGPIELM